LLKAAEIEKGSQDVVEEKKDSHEEAKEKK
jgi:hypothetical protein